MNQLKKFSAAFAVLAVLASACTKRAAESPNTFHMAIADDVKTFDPANAYDVISLDVLPNVLESLYQYSYLSDSITVEPLVAADMPKLSDDHLTMTIRIRKGIRFSDDKCFKDGKGRELTADDFIYSFKRLALPSIESQGWWIFDGRIVGIKDFRKGLENAKNKKDLEAAMAMPVEGFKALDPYTLQIKLTKPYPQLRYILTMGFTAALPHEAVEAYADEKGNMTNHPVGTGPFVLKQWDRNRQIVLERNPNYHPDFYPTRGSISYQTKGMLADAGKPIPFVDRVVFDVIRETQPSWLGFMKGNHDAITIPKDNFGQAITHGANLTPELVSKGVRLTVETGSAFYYITFNFRDPLFAKNKYLRQALALAIDRDQWIDLFTNGTGLKMVTALPPGVADRPGAPSLKYDFNLARAKELLKKAGYPDGKGLPVLHLEMRGADSVSRQLGDFFTRQWAAIGVNVEAVLNTFPAYLEKLKKGTAQIVYDGWTMDYPDAENVYQLLYGPNQAPGPNDANFDNKELNKLYEQMAVMEVGPKRAALIHKMDDLIQEEVPWALGYYFARYDLSQPWVLNYRSGDVIQNRYKYLRIDTELKKRYLSGH